MKTAQTRMDKGEAEAPPRPLRLKLVTAEDCRKELARVYRDAKGGRLEIGDASRLGNLLAILARMVEASDIERRLDALEQGAANGKP